MITIQRREDGAVITTTPCPNEGLPFATLQYRLAAHRIDGMLEQNGVMVDPDGLIQPGTVLTLVVPRLPTRAEARERFASSALLKWPPSGLTCDVLRDIQREDDPGFLDFRPSYALPHIPLQLAHPAFGYFVDTLTSTTDLPNKEDSLCFAKLVRVTSMYHKKEAELVDAVFPILQSYLGFESLQTNLSVGGGRSADMGITNSIYEENISLALAFFGFKLLSSANRGDPYTEGIHYVNCFWDHYSSGFLAYHDSCYPGFVIEVVGPLLRVTAVARIGGKICAQPLTMFINLLTMNGYNSVMVEQGVRVLSTLKKSLHKLAEFYSEFQSRPGDIGARLWNSSIPYPLHSTPGSTPVKIGQLLYLVDLAGGQKVAVKFAQRYGLAVHAAWAGAGFAPAMTWRNLAGGWIEITMEYLGPGWKSLDKCANAETLRPAVVEALRAAHRVQIEEGETTGVGVHGDCRDCNVMVRESEGRIEVRFIDFEWSSIHGSGRYPLFMNQVQVNWPRGAEDNAVMYQEHDLQMIAKPSFQQLKLIA